MAKVIDRGCWNEDEARSNSSWTISFDPPLSKSSSRPEQPENKLVGQNGTARNDTDGEYRI
jgi:hypothetical protein